MLRALLLLATLSPLSTRAMSTLAEPERLTSGDKDQFLGALGPAGERLFYVSNEHATTEIRSIDVPTRTDGLVIDEAADVTWPRVSPDGRRLLYISYRSAATGEPCLHDLPPLGHDFPLEGLDVSDRDCFALHGRAALQAVWMPDGNSILVVTRNGLGGDMDLRRVPLRGSGDGDVVLKHGLSSPTVSPDGKWLVYVPLVPTTDKAPSTLSGRAGTGLALLRLDQPTEAPREVKLDLPGQTGFPAFSFDGRFLYFSQYLNDTNHDGVVDGNDHAVLFRVAFDSSSTNPVAVGDEEQLTSAQWDCQYPFPGKERLITTCLYEGSLDVFSLPLDGMIPRAWTPKKLMEELSSNNRPWERLLVLTRLYELDTAPTDTSYHLKRIIEQHLDLHEYQSVGFYTRKLEDLAGTQQGDWWREEEGISKVVHELERHRKWEESLTLGQVDAGFVKGSRERLTRLEPLSKSAYPAVAAMAALVMSEINHSLGEMGAALSLLKSVHVDEHARHIELHLLAHLARELYGLFNERDKLLDVDLLLSRHPRFEEDERLAYAQDYVCDLLRGHTAMEQKALLDEARRHLPPDSSAALVVTLEQMLSGLTPETQDAVSKDVLALFDRLTSIDQRRALVHMTVQRAQETNSERIWSALVERWSSVVDPGHSERKRTDEMYRRMVLERAYVEWSRGEVAAAREHFDAVAQHTSSLDAIAGHIDTSLLAGRSVPELEAEYRQRFVEMPDAPELHFALAHLLAVRMSTETDPDSIQRQATEGVEHLKIALRGVPNNIPIHFLWGHLRHIQFLRTGAKVSDKHIALRANSHYLIALDLARDKPRYKAAILQALGFLQAKAQNYSMAASFFDEREKLPFVVPETELAECVTKALCLMHADREKESAKLSDRCVEIVGAHGKLAQYLPYVLDHSAIEHFAAGEFAAARARWDQLQPIVERGSPGEPDNHRNRFVLHVGRAAAELGAHQPREALADLDEAEKLFKEPGGIPLLLGSFARKTSLAFSQEQMKRDYALLFPGLRAEAFESLHDYPDARAQIERRRTLLMKRAKTMQESQEDLALVEANLAFYAYQEGDMAAAVAHTEAGLRWVDAVVSRTGTLLDRAPLMLLLQYADLHFQGKVPLENLKLDLPGRLARLYDELCDRPDPRWAAMRSLYGIYLNRLSLEGAQVNLQ